jgi:hypothetical protein
MTADSTPHAPSARPTAEAFVVAIVTPAALFAAVTDWIMVIPALYATAAHALVLGLPWFLFLRSNRWLNLPVVMASGMAIGLLPIAIVTCPLWLSSSPTAFEWRGYVSSACLFSAFGGIAAMAFWAYLRLRQRMGPHHPVAADL